MTLTALGIVGGVAVAAVGTRALGGLLYGIRPLDAASFAASAMALVVTGLLGAWIPARRARADPLEILRT